MGESNAQVRITAAVICPECNMVMPAAYLNNAYVLYCSNPHCDKRGMLYSQPTVGIERYPHAPAKPRAV